MKMFENVYKNCFTTKIDRKNGEKRCTGWIHSFAAAVVDGAVRKNHLVHFAKHDKFPLHKMQQRAKLFARASYSAWKMKNLKKNNSYCNSVAEKLRPIC